MRGVTATCIVRFESYRACCHQFIFHPHSKLGGHIYYHIKPASGRLAPQSNGCTQELEMTSLMNISLVRIMGFFLLPGRWEIIIVVLVILLLFGRRIFFGLTRNPSGHSNSKKISSVSRPVLGKNIEGAKENLSTEDHSGQQNQT